MSCLRRRIPTATLAVIVLVAGFPGRGPAAGEDDSRTIAARPVKNVGIVYDGPPPEHQGDALHRFDTLVELVREETASLTRRDLAVAFPADKRLTADWTVAGIHRAVDRLLADPEVDLVLTFGIFASHDVCQRRDLPKPVLAPLAVDIDAQSLPVTSDAEGRFTSGVRNLTYLVSPGCIQRDLKRFREIVDVSTVHVLTDALLPEAIAEIPAAVTEGARQVDLELVVVPAVDTAAEVLAALPADAEAVYVTPLNRMPRSEFELLVAGLRERRLPSFSLMGRDEVELGVMAGARPQTDPRRVSRRIALNIQRILAGEDAGTLPVALELQEKLVINMATATAIRVFPRVRVAMEAELIQTGTDAITETLGLSQAVREAVAANLGLRAAERRVTAGAEDVRRARSRLRPQLEVSAQGLQIDQDRAAASFGSQAERTPSGALSLSQLLYSDGARAGVEISRHLQRSLETELEIEQLDVALATATAFLDVLRAETLERIAGENRRLTESHLELARRREQIGSSGPADVYRWESRLATDRSSLIAAHAAVHTALVALNRLRHRPLEELYAATPPKLTDPELVTGSGRLFAYVDNAASFSLFKEFHVGEGLAKSPELRASGAAIDARERAELAARRSFFAPEVGLVAELEEDIATGGAGSGVPIGPIAPADSTDYSIAIEARLPLFTGGARKAELRQASAELARLRFERDALAESVELRIRAALYQVSASFPAIELAQEAAAAARRNLEMVTASYSRGVVSVIELIDAQNAALVAEATAANAVYDFLIDLMELQRATNTFDFFLTAAGREAWFERLETYFEDNADKIRWPTR